MIWTMRVMSLFWRRADLPRRSRFPTPGLQQEVRRSIMRRIAARLRQQGGRGLQPSRSGTALEGERSDGPSTR